MCRTQIKPICISLPVQVASPHAYTAPQQAWDYAHTPSGGAAMGLHAYPSAANFSHTPSQLSKLLMQAPLPQTLGEIQLWQQAQAQQQQQQQQYGGSVSFGGDGGGGGASGSGLGGSRPSHQQKSNSLSLVRSCAPMFATACKPAAGTGCAPSLMAMC